MEDPNVTFEPAGHPDRQPTHVPRPSLNHDQLGAVLAQIRDSETRPSVKNSLIFNALTAARGVEVCNANWDEFDLEANTWTVPPNHTKNSRQHLVPLSSQAIAILRHTQSLHHHRNDVVFQPARAKRLSPAMMLATLKDLNPPTILHGFRTSFSNWAAERRDTNLLVVEACLAHQPICTHAEMVRSHDFFELRRELLQEWANYLQETMGPVISPKDM